MSKKNLRSVFQTAVAAVMCISLLFPAVSLWAASGDYDSIAGLSDEILYDTEGREVYANGGEVHQVTENGKTKWYWFGEDFSYDSTGEGSAVRGIHLYSSADLYNWTREEDIFKGMSSKAQFDTDDYFKNLYGSLSESEKNTVFECLQNCPTAHPRVLYNEKTHQYVMWVSYLNGKQCIATSSSIKGPFKFVKYCESVEGFTELYKESDGTAYIIYQSGTGIFISKLTDDYMDVEGTAQDVHFSGGTLGSAEVGMFKQNGKYYMVNAGAKQYAMADSLTGTWTVHTLQMYDDEKQVFEDVPDTLNPTHQILQVNTEDGTTYINITDRWNEEGPYARYAWLPIKFSENDTIALRKLSNWKLDMGNTDIDIAVTKVNLTETSKTMKVGEKYRIEATVVPTNATNKNLSYRSSDDSVASVSDAGLVEAKKAGNAMVTVTSANGKTAEFKVTVEAVVNPPIENPPVEIPPVEVIEVRLTETSKMMKVGEKYQIGVTVVPENADNKTLSYESSNESVASVSGAGLVEAKKSGTVTVTVTSANGKMADLRITVMSVPEPEPERKIDVIAVSILTDRMTVGIGERVQLDAEVYPNNASDRELTYTSSNNKVSVSKNGVITALKTGTCKITITSSNKKTAVVNVTVKKKPGKISLNSNKKILKVGKSFQIKPKLPKGTASCKITYTSNKESIATVSPNGKVTARKKGNAVITVKTYNGKKASLKIHVN